MNIEHLLQRDYWHALAESIWIWLEREVFVGHTLINLVAVVAAILLAGLIARALKPKLSEIVEKRISKHTALSRFLSALEQILTQVTAIILLWVALAAFRQLGLKIYLLDLVESLLIAWVSIRLVSSIVRQVYLSRIFAFTAYTVAALHILSLLNPTLVLLDSLAVHVGEAKLSVLLLIKTIIILSVLMWLAVSVSAIVGKRISSIDRLTPSMQIFLTKIVTLTGIITAILITVNSLGIDLTTFAFIGGAVGLGIGFGLQKVVSNLFSGLILLLDQSIKPGDVIAIDDTYGQIRSMGARYVSIAGEPLSLDAPLNSDATRFLGDAIGDDNFMDPFNSTVSRNLEEKMRKILAMLSPREEKILRMRFGIGEKTDHTLDEISREFDLTRERIRQIEARALKKLQHSAYSRNLRAFFER